MKYMNTSQKKIGSPKLQKRNVQYKRKTKILMPLVQK